VVGRRLRFASVNGADLLAEIQSLMKGFGSEFTVILGEYLVHRLCKVRDADQAYLKRKKLGL
jgi:hypothetical protein